MGRLIDSNALSDQVKSLKMRVQGTGSVKSFLAECMKAYQKSVIQIIESQPTVDAVPVVYSKWEEDGDWLICLNCESEINKKNSLGVANRKNFCPNCGAKMDKEKDDGE